jgi:hypothetical protein
MQGRSMMLLWKWCPEMTLDRHLLHSTQNAEAYLCFVICRCCGSKLKLVIVLVCDCDALEGGFEVGNVRHV